MISATIIPALQTQPEIFNKTTEPQLNQNHITIQSRTQPQIQDEYEYPSQRL